MSYIFNRINLIVVIVMIFLITMSLNEVAHYAKKLNLSNQAAYAQWFTSKKTVFATQEECQTSTNSLCNYEECNYIPNSEQALEEVCDKSYTKGWRPTVVAIPTAYQNLASIKLTMGTASEQETLVIDSKELTMTYTSNLSKVSTIRSKSIKVHDITLLVNTMISYEFLRIADNLRAKPTIDQTLPSYSLVLTSTTEGTSGTTQAMNSVQCEPAECPRTIIDIKNDIVRLWGEPITDITR